MASAFFFEFSLLAIHLRCMRGCRFIGQPYFTDVGWCFVAWLFISVRSDLRSLATAWGNYLWCFSKLTLRGFVIVPQYRLYAYSLRLDIPSKVFWLRIRKSRVANGNTRTRKCQHTSPIDVQYNIYISLQDALEIFL